MKSPPRIPNVLAIRLVKVRATGQLVPRAIIERWRQTVLRSRDGSVHPRSHRSRRPRRGRMDGANGVGDFEPGTEKSAEAIRRRERVVLLVLATVQFTSIVDFMLVMPLGPQLMERLKLDTTQFGLIVSSYTFSAGVAGLFAASFIERFGRKSAFLVIYIGFLWGTLCCGLAWSYPTLLAARVLTGAFGGGARRGCGGAGDHQRRLPRPSPRRGDRGPDVGLLGRAIGLRRPIRAHRRGRLRLAEAVPGPGGSGDDRPGRRRPGDAPAPGAPGASPRDAPDAGDLDDAQPAEPPPGVRGWCRR